MEIENRLGGQVIDPTRISTDVSETNHLRADSRLRRGW